MPTNVTLESIKGFLEIQAATTEFDNMLTGLLNAVVVEMVDFLDNPEITGQATMPTVLEKSIFKQVAYEFRRRKDIGLSSTAFPDGSVNKYTVDEWLPDVEAKLARERIITL